MVWASPQTKKKPYNNCTWDFITPEIEKILFLRNRSTTILFLCFFLLKGDRIQTGVFCRESPSPHRPLVIFGYSPPPSSLNEGNRSAFTFQKKGEGGGSKISGSKRHPPSDHILKDMSANIVFPFLKWRNYLSRKKGIIVRENLNPFPTHSHWGERDILNFEIWDLGCFLPGKSTCGRREILRAPIPQTKTLRIEKLLSQCFCCTVHTSLFDGGKEASWWCVCT